MYDIEIVLLSFYELNELLVDGLPVRKAIIDSSDHFFQELKNSIEVLHYL